MVNDEDIDIARTPWFKASDLPARVGPYEVSTHTGYLGWCWWDGKRWGSCWPRLEQAQRLRSEWYGGRCFHWVMEWRGLVSDPNLSTDWRQI